MTIQSQIPAAFDLALPAITGGFGVSIGVIIGIVTGAHLAGRDRITRTRRQAAPVTGRQVEAARVLILDPGTMTALPGSRVEAARVVELPALDRPEVTR